LPTNVLYDGNVIKCNYKTCGAPFTTRLTTLTTQTARLDSVI